MHNSIIFSFSTSNFFLDRRLSKILFRIYSGKPSGHVGA